MYLLGEPLDKVRKFQTHVVRLAMETDMRATRCRVIHPERTTGISSCEDASDEYAAALERTRRKHLLFTRRVYMGLPTQRRKPLMRQLEVAFPATARAPLYAWLTSAPRSAKPTHQERRAKRKVGETTPKAATPATKPGPLRVPRIAEMKRGRDGCKPSPHAPPASAKRRGKKPDAPCRGWSATAGASPTRRETHECHSQSEGHGTEGARPRTRAPAKKPTPPTLFFYF